MMMIKWQDSTPNRFGFYIKLYGRLMTCDALYEAAVIQSVSDGWPGTRSEGDEKEAQMTMNLNPKCHNWGLFTFNLSTYCWTAHPVIYWFDSHPPTHSLVYFCAIDTATATRVGPRKREIGILSAFRPINKIYRNRYNICPDVDAAQIEISPFSHPP